MKASAIVVLVAILALSPAFADPTVASDYHQKQHDLEVRAALAEKIAQLTGHEEAMANTMEDAQRRILLCKQCHGADGNAIVEGVPNLAGQNPVYLVDQFMRYGDGRRYDYTMSSLAGVIKDEDKIKLAIYFSQQKTKPAGGGRTELIPDGKELYGKLCAECHGADGRGEEGYARLAGQQPDYLVKILKVFKNETGRRSNPWMTQRAGALSEEDMEAVATFLANLP